jgi:hypothetical protein
VFQDSTRHKQAIIQHAGGSPPCSFNGFLVRLYKEVSVTSSRPKTAQRVGSQAQRPDGIPQTLLFFILKQLETPHPAVGIQQDPLQ